MPYSRLNDTPLAIKPIDISSNYCRKVLVVLVSCALVFAVYKFYMKQTRPTILIITPTHKRLERLADMTRLSQTLMLVPDIFWIVVEDGNTTVSAVNRILERSGIPYVYMSAVTPEGFPPSGWVHRNLALSYIRSNYRSDDDAIIFFTDDDNTYDIRLFNDYIRNVKTLGFWAVGTVGGALVETPRAKNGIIVGWDVVYKPERKYPVDMAAFAVHVSLLIKSNASFNVHCANTQWNDPETCLVEQFNVPKEKAQVFGCESTPKDILVWHTKTSSSGKYGGKNGYIIEI